MVFARRSLLRATFAAQSLRASPVCLPGQTLGRRFYASGHGGEEHKSSDLPWCVSPMVQSNQHSANRSMYDRLLGSVGIGGPVIAYLVMSGPEKKPHGGGHGAHKEESAGQEEEESPPEPVEESKTEPEGEKQTAEKKDDVPPSQEQKVGTVKTGHDEVCLPLYTYTLHLGCPCTNRRLARRYETPSWTNQYVSQAGGCVKHQ